MDFFYFPIQVVPSARKFSNNGLFYVNSRKKRRCAFFSRHPRRWSKITQFFATFVLLWLSGLWTSCTVTVFQNVLKCFKMNWYCHRSKCIMPYSCSHFYFDINFCNIFYLKEKRPALDTLGWEANSQITPQFSRFSETF